MAIPPERVLGGDANARNTTLLLARAPATFTDERWRSGPNTQPSPSPRWNLRQIVVWDLVSLCECGANQQAKLNRNVSQITFWPAKCGQEEIGVLWGGLVLVQFSRVSAVGVGNNLHRPLHTPRHVGRETIIQGGWLKIQNGFEASLLCEYRIVSVELSCWAGVKLNQILIYNTRYVDSKK